MESLSVDNDKTSVNSDNRSVSEDEDAKDRGSSTGSAISNPAENELINLDEVELSDEDTWLYTSPNGITNEEKDMSPYKWLRKDIEDPNKRELQIAKTALVNKLDELEILKTVHRTETVTKDAKEKELDRISNDADFDKDSFISSSEDASTINDTSSTNYCTENQCSPISPDTSASEATDIEKKLAPPEHQPYSDAMDVFEKARLQEESLKESSSRFFNQTTRSFPRGTRSSLPHSGSVAGFQKPASIDVIHANHVDLNSSVPSSLNSAKLPSNSSSLSPFGSTVSLSYSPESHRSSLPNLNKNYYSLKSKKPKRTSEPKSQCPLPFYPKPEAIGTNRAVPHFGGSTADCCRESQTLPSSYRNKCKIALNHSSTLPRRESAPSSHGPRNLLHIHSLQQNSAPFIMQTKERPNGKLPSYSSSPRKNSAPATQSVEELSPSLQSLKSVSLNHLPREPKISPIKEYSRQKISPSQTKRQPLSSMHNYSPEEDSCSSLQRNDLKKSSLPSRMPSAVPRSGIPVPSSQYVAKSSHADGGWNKDYY